MSEAHPIRLDPNYPYRLTREQTENLPASETDRVEDWYRLREETGAIHPSNARLADTLDEAIRATIAGANTHHLTNLQPSDYFETSPFATAGEKAQHLYQGHLEELEGILAAALTRVRAQRTHQHQWKPNGFCATCGLDGNA